MSHAKNRIPEEVATLGEAIRWAREQRQMSLRGLAEEVGVSAPFLSDLEHNRRSTDRLDDFARALEIPVDELRRFDARLTPELKDWISANPGMVALLKEWRANNQSPDDIRMALNRTRKR